MKKYRKLLTFSIVLLAIVGCGKSKEMTQEEHPGELSGEITFWHSFTQGPRFESINEAAKEFEEENPNVKIKIETFSWDDFYTKWTTGLSSGNIPDMSTALPNHVIEMIDSGALVPLNNVINNIGRDRFSEAALSEGTLNNNNYSIPLYSHAQVMWYRKDLLEKHDLEVPKTWNEFAKASEILSEEGVYGVSFPTGANDLMGTRFLNFYVRSKGASLLTEDLKANLTSTESIEGIKYWVDLYHKVSPKDSISYNVLDQATLFYQGKTAFDFNSGFQIGGVEANSPELLDQIDSAPIPKFRESDPDIGIETSNIPLVVWEKSENQAISKAFTEFLFEKERYIEFLSATPVGMLPSLSDIIEEPTYQENEVITKFSNSVQVISEAVERGTAIGYEHGPSVQAGLLTSQGVIEGMFQDIIVNNKSIEQAAEAAEKKLNDIFETVQP